MMPTYWLNVFTFETWNEAREHGFSVSGFTTSRRRAAERMCPGDVLLCYLSRSGRFPGMKLVGTLRVTGSAFYAEEPRIWQSDVYPVRIAVEPLILLDIENALDFRDLLPQLSFYDATNSRRTWAHLQGSPVALREEDGRLLFEALERQAGVTIAAEMEDASPEAELVQPPAAPRLVSLVDPLEALVSEISEAQRDATHPNRFEQVVAQAFSFLGFDVTSLGRSGTTDVVVDSPLGHDRFRSVVEVKASGSGRVPEGQINWPTINAHRQQTSADHAMVVGERFAGGNLHRFAADFGVALLDTESLIEVLRLHSATPYSAADFRPLFSTAGLVSAVIADLRQKAQTMEHHWRLIAEIIRIVDGFSRADLPLTPTPGSLHAVLVAQALDRRSERMGPPSEQDVRDAVAFLSSRAVGVLRVVDPETAGYRLTMSRATALERLRALAGSIRGRLESTEYPDRASSQLGSADL